ncbi:hypothetical protein MTO96_006619 [Rhipicephalus appendiculatus]
MRVSPEGKNRALKEKKVIKASGNELLSEERTPGMCSSPRSTRSWTDVSTEPCWRLCVRSSRLPHCPAGPVLGGANRAFGQIVQALFRAVSFGLVDSCVRTLQRAHRENHRARGREDESSSCGRFSAAVRLV